MQGRFDIWGAEDMTEWKAAVTIAGIYSDIAEDVMMSEELKTAGDAAEDAMM
jgi:D-mannonate dehydratase